MTSARQKALIAVRNLATRDNLNRARAEDVSRSAPITGTLTGYNPVTGDRVVALGCQGVVEARLIGNTNPSGRLPVSRTPSSATTTVFSPTTAASADGNSPTELEATADNLVVELSPQALDRDPVEADARHINDLAFNTDSGALSLWDGTQWVPIGGGGLSWTYTFDPPNLAGTPWSDGAIVVDQTSEQWWRATDDRFDSPTWLPLGNNRVQYYNGDPHDGWTLSQIEWLFGGLVYDEFHDRVFIARRQGNPQGDNETLRWVPVAPKVWDASSLASATTYYAGDLYQASDGAFYRLTESGNWVVQWYCPECTTDPSANAPDSPCLRFTGWDQVGDGWEQVFEPC